MSGLLVLNQTTMTSRSNSVTLNFSEPEIDQRILPCSPVLSSHSLGWQGIYVQHHRQPAWETPECSHFQHTIVVHSATSSARIERRLDGLRRDERIFQGEIVVAPASVQHQVRWDREIDYTLLVLEPDYIAQIAHEEIDPESVEILPHFAHIRSTHLSNWTGAKEGARSG